MQEPNKQKNRSLQGPEQTPFSAASNLRKLFFWRCRLLRMKLRRGFSKAMVNHFNQGKLDRFDAFLLIKNTQA